MTTNVCWYAFIGTTDPTALREHTTLGFDYHPRTITVLKKFVAERFGYQHQIKCARIHDCGQVHITIYDKNTDFSWEYRGRIFKSTSVTINYKPNPNLNTTR